VCDIVVLTWAIYCLAVNTDIQAAAREEVKRVCSETGDITADDVNGMMYVSCAIHSLHVGHCAGRR